MVHLIRSQITTSVGSGQGKGGNITIDPRFVILDHSAVRADAFGGPGGNVRIAADIYLTSASDVSASSALGVPGTIDIEARTTNMSGTLTRLPEGLLQAVTLLRASCARRVSAGRASSLVVSRRRGISIDQDGVLPNALFTGVLLHIAPPRTEGQQSELVPSVSLSVFRSDCLN